MEKTLDSATCDDTKNRVEDSMGPESSPSFEFWDVVTYGDHPSPSPLEPSNRDESPERLESQQVALYDDAQNAVEDSMEMGVKGLEGEMARQEGQQTGPYSAKLFLQGQQQQNQGSHLQQHHDSFETGKSMLASTDLGYTQFDHVPTQAMPEPCFSDASWEDASMGLDSNFDISQWWSDPTASMQPSEQSFEHASLTSFDGDFSHASSPVKASSSGHGGWSTELSTPASKDERICSPAASNDLWDCGFVGCTKSFSHQHKLK